MRSVLIVSLALLASCGACQQQSQLLPDPDRNRNNSDKEDEEVETNNMTTEPPPETIPPCALGSITGHVCAVTGQPLAAEVFLEGMDCETGEPFELSTQSNNYGTFSFAHVSPGQHRVRIGDGFNTVADVEVLPGEHADVQGERICVESDANVALISGSFDHVEQILEYGNVEFTLIGTDEAEPATVAFLQDVDQLSEYDVLFINCGYLYYNLEAMDADGTLMATVAASLRAFVEGGGSLYVSDWAAPFVEDAFPDMIDFLGDDASHVGYRAGAAPLSVEAEILSPQIMSLLGRETAVVEWDLGGWAVAVGAGEDSVVHLQGDVPFCGSDTCVDAPLLVTYTVPSGGTVMFTTFHNERQVTLNQDMEAILRYLVFSL